MEDWSINVTITSEEIAREVYGVVSEGTVLTTPLDAWGNTAADGLATHGMHRHVAGEPPLRWTLPSAGLRRVKLPRGPEDTAGLHHDLR